MTRTEHSVTTVEPAQPAVSRAVYGIITTLATLQIFEAHPPDALAGAVILFGGTLAVALVEVYSDTMEKSMILGRGVNRVEFLHLVGEARPVMVGAQAPTVIMLITATGLFSLERGVDLAETAAFVSLFLFGWMVGGKLHERWYQRLLSGLMLTAIGAVIVLVKAAFH